MEIDYKKVPGVYMPDPCKLSWDQDKGLLNNGKPRRLRGFGAYFDFERDDLSDAFLHNYFWFLYDCGFNMLRVFVVSRFNQVRLNSMSLNSWCPWVMENGKYNLEKINSKFLENMQRFAVFAGRWGIALQVVLFDHCGFKVNPDSRFGWNVSPFNKTNTVPGSPGWEYTGSAYFKYHKMWNEAKYPRLRTVTENYVRNIVNAVCRYPNIILELTNEAPEDLKDFLHLVIGWCEDQYVRSGSPFQPIFADSSELLSAGDQVHIRWSHNHLQLAGFPVNAVSTDGSRISEFPGDRYEKAYRGFYFDAQYHFETHMQFFSTLPGMNTEEVYALTWLAGKKLVDPRTDWVTLINDSLQINRKIGILAHDMGLS